MPHEILLYLYVGACVGVCVCVCVCMCVHMTVHVCVCVCDFKCVGVTMYSKPQCRTWLQGMLVVHTQSTLRKKCATLNIFMTMKFLFLLRQKTLISS